MRLFAPLVAIGLAACGRDPGLPADPCSLLTVRIVEQTLQESVERVRQIPDEELHFPEGPNPCEYRTGGHHEAISVTVDPDGLDDFVRLRDGDPANVEPVAELGDEAFTHGLSAVFVRIGDGYFVIASQQGASRAGGRDLRRLADAALDRLEFRASGTG